MISSRARLWIDRWVTTIPCGQLQPQLQINYANMKVENHH